jgi:hypothetical protein
LIERVVEFDTIISSAALALHARLYEFSLHQVVEYRDAANVFDSQIRIHQSRPGDHRRHTVASARPSRASSKRLLNRSTSLLRCTAAEMVAE